MAEFVVKIADDRGRVQQHIEQGYSEAEVRDRFSQQGYLVYWVKPQGMLTSGSFAAPAKKAEAGHVSGV